MSSEINIVLAIHDQKMSERFTALLGAQGFQVQTCTTARSLQEILSHGPVSLVVLGVLFPDANGLEVAKYIKSDKQLTGVRVVLLSSLKRSAKFAMEATTKFMADLYLEMPIEPDELVQEIRRLLFLETAETGDQPAAPPLESKIKETKTGRPYKTKPVEKAAAAKPPRPRRATVEKTPPRAPAGSRVEEIPDSGRLGQILLPELLLSLYERRAEGTLTIKTWEEQREIILRDGLPVAIRSNFIPDDALGQILISRGLVERSEVDSAVTKSKAVGRKLGEVLIAEGLLAPHDLNTLLRIQAKRKLNSAFRWKEGSYTFATGEIDLTNALEIQQDMLSMLIFGISRHYDLSKLEMRLFLNKDAIVVKGQAKDIAPADLNVSRQEWRLLDLINGVRTLGEVIADSDLNFSRTFQLLYLFLLFGIIRFKDGDRFFRLDDAVTYRARSEARRFFARFENEEEQKIIGEAPPPRGDLRDMPLVRFLFHLYLTQASGRLTLRREDHEESFYLENGIPVRVHSNRIGPLALGNLLVEQGKITTLERDKTLDQAKSTGRPFGETLLTNGLISPHELFEALMSQLENKLVAIFRWQDGAYEFEEGISDAQESVPITIDLTRLVLRGIKDSVQFERMEAELRKYRAFPLVRVNRGFDLSSMFSDPRESALVVMIDGRKTLGELLDRSLLETTRAVQIIFSLLQLGLVRFKED